MRAADLDIVVRVSPASAGLLTISRDAEYANTSRAAACGVAPDVLDYLPGQGVLAVRFLPSTTFDEMAVRDNLARVISLLRQLHTGPAFVNDFDIFETRDRYLATMDERRWPVPTGYEHLEDAAELLRRALRSGPEVRVPCHNDLLAANLLDDGTRLWLIDFEYSGNNEPAFELGNLAQENHLSDEQLIELTELYYDRHDERLIARARLWQIASAYAWPLWGAISARINPLDFDFDGWAQEKLERARAGLSDNGFADLCAMGAAG